MTQPQPNQRPSDELRETQAANVEGFFTIEPIDKKAVEEKVNAEAKAKQLSIPKRIWN